MKTSYLTDSGRVRSHNEDSVTILKNTSGEYLLIVADGMGGHRKGEVASSIVVTTLGKRFNNLATVGTKLDAVNWLNDTVNDINNEILTYGMEHEDSTGLGTTIVCALVTPTFLIFGNIGDSSGYVIKNNKLHKVTNDHTLVNLLVAAGNISVEEAKNHPQKNVLMKALGAGEKAEIDIFAVESDYDGVFLCSDGLTNMLTDSQIEKVLEDEELDINEKVEKLIRKCNARGGNDNISVAYLVKESGEE